MALPDQTIWVLRIFNGLRDTLRILLDAQPKIRREPALLAQLGRNWNPRAIPSRLRSLAARLCLDELAKHAEEALSKIDGIPIIGPENQAGWWARAFAGQCRAALDEFNACRPVVAITAIDEIPTLRELHDLETIIAAERITGYRKARVAMRRTQPHAV